MEVRHRPNISDISWKIKDIGYIMTTSIKQYRNDVSVLPGAMISIKLCDPTFFKVFYGNLNSGSIFTEAYIGDCYIPRSIDKIRNKINWVLKHTSKLLFKLRYLLRSVKIPMLWYKPIFVFGCFIQIRIHQALLAI